MKHKVSQLDGALLDAAVAVAEGYPVRNTRFGYEMDFPSYLDEMGQDGCYSGAYSPSDNWAQGGPIIERERIVAWRPDVIKHHVWAAIHPESKGLGIYSGHRIDVHYHDGMPGPTLLVAAMRAYVASKFGEDVELP